jgi:serine-type D-Ala-D-Ala carboxypeptidase (penicillin-binding protein 5/6)
LIFMASPDRREDMKKLLWILAVLAGVVPALQGAPISRDPYLGAITIDANTGDVLFEDTADRPGYPASMLKLMDLFIILDRVKQGGVRLEDPVQVTKEAMSMGGSQVYLDPRERFTVDELLYALMVQSANDAAMALALHVAGTRDGFVRMMNDKAQELGLSPVTQFQSPHGLPPGQGQRPDITTPRDFAKLCRALLQAHPDALKYTSITYKVFRQNPLFEMRTHNHLLGAVPGCDGLKTGYFTDAGYSIAATAQRDGARVIAVVMGSVDRKVRDAKATELLARGLLDASRAPASQPVVQVPSPVPAADVPAVAADDEAQGEDLPEAAEEKTDQEQGRGWLKNLGLVLLGAFLAAVVGMAIQRRLLLSR